VIRSITILLLLGLFFGGCSTQKVGHITLKSIKPNYAFTSDSIPAIPNYKDTDFWYLYQDDIESEIDVFFVHPTMYLSEENWNQPLEDSLVTAKTYRKSIRSQALLFDSIANLFAPRYRQATFYSFFDTDSNGVKALNVAYEDIKKAFIVYMSEVNNDRPLIIAGHSQGAFLAIRLLKEKEIQDLIGDKLIVAYLIGWPVLESDLKEIPYSFCQEADQTDCLCSWNTQKAHATLSSLSYAKGEKRYSTNPLSWTSDDKYYDKSYNHGALILKKDSMIFRPNYVGARNYKGILAIDRPKGKKELGIPRLSRNYHVYDIAFFYRNIQENALRRKEVFLK